MSPTVDVLDEEGDLFGVLNVVDALVVLVVLAVVVAGAALLLPSEPEPDPGPDLGTTNVTLDLGSQPSYIVSAIDSGDAYRPSGNDQLTVTDVHVTPGSDGPRVIVRARLQGTANDDGITYAEAPPRLGRSLSIETDRYTVDGQIRAVGGNETLPTARTTAVLRDEMSSADAREVTAGDEIRIGGRTVATIEDVAAYATGDDSQRVVFAEVSLHAHLESGEPRFGGQTVTAGQSATLANRGYTLDGRIERVGTLERSSADVLLETVVDAETATRIADGDVATVAGHRTAEVEQVETYATGNPDRRRVAVGLSLETLTGGERETFGTVALQRGNEITVDHSEYELTGSIERVGALEPRGSIATRTVTLRMAPVRDDVAENFRPGMSERTGGETTARVTNVAVEPTRMVLTGDDASLNVVDHPYNREVTLTTDLRVRETTTGLEFKGQTVQQGSTVSLDLGTTTIDATVASIGG